MSEPLLIWPGGAQGSRNQYVRQRVATRMLARGEPMQLRRITLINAGPVPYPNPPTTSADISVSSAIVASDGNTYLALAATTINGRLVAGDQIIVGGVTWTVQTMPTTVLTDGDGIPIGFGAHGGNQVTFGVPVIYNADTLAANNAFSLVCVTAPGAPDPTPAIGQPVVFDYAADEVVYGRVLTLEEMTRKSWVQTNTIGVNIAAMTNGVLIDIPAIDDLIWINGQQRAVMSVGSIFRSGINFMYSLQCS